MPNREGEGRGGVGEIRNEGREKGGEGKGMEEGEMG